MLGKIIAICILVLASFGAYAGVDMGAFEQLNVKIDCIIAHGGFQSRNAKAICIDKTETAHKTVSSSKKDTYKRDAKGLHHWKKVNANPAKAAYRASAKGAHPEVFIGKKVHDDLIAIGLTSNDMDKVFHPIFNQVQDNFGLLKGDEVVNHHKQWDAMLRSGAQYPDFIQKGDILSHLSFRKGVIPNVIADFNGNLPTFVFPLENGKELLWIPLCQNFAIREGKQLSLPVVPETKKIIKEPFKISLKKEVNERRAIVEVNAGVWGGAYFGKNYEGKFWGGQGWVYVPIEQFLGSEEQISVGIGIYGSQDDGSSRQTAYQHERSRLLGLVGVKGNGFDEDFNPHWWSVNLGYGSAWLNGGNQSSGYWMKQKTQIGRLYAEYLTQRGEMLYAAFGEGFLDLGGGSNYHSSWSGFPGEGESAARVGGYAEWRFHKNFSIKGVAAMTFGQSDGVTSKFGNELGLYGCYRDGWDEGYGFAIGCIGGGVNIGQGVIPYVGANVFVGQVFTHYVEHKRAEGIRYEPEIYKQHTMSRIPGASPVMNVAPKETMNKSYK
jgi:hypothetical protein